MNRERSRPQADAVTVRLDDHAHTLHAVCTGGETVIFLDGSPALRCAGQIRAIWTLGALRVEPAGCRR